MKKIGLLVLAMMISQIGLAAQGVRCSIKVEVTPKNAAAEENPLLALLNAAGAQKQGEVPAAPVEPKAPAAPQYEEVLVVKFYFAQERLYFTQPAHRISYQAKTKQGLIEESTLFQSREITEDWELPMSGDILVEEAIDLKANVFKLSKAGFSESFYVLKTDDGAFSQIYYYSSYGMEKLEDCSVF